MPNPPTTSTFTTLLRFAAHCIAGLLVAAGFLSVVPHAIQSLVQTQVKLPTITLQLHAVSTFVGNLWFILIPTLALLDLVILYLLETRMTSKAAIHLWFTILLLMATAALLWALIAIVIAIPRFYEPI